jgi:hypothetical protein
MKPPIPVVDAVLPLFEDAVAVPAVSRLESVVSLAYRAVYWAGRRRLGAFGRRLGHPFGAPEGRFDIQDSPRTESETERGPIFWTGKLMLIYQLVRRVHETHTPPYFHGRI